MGDGRSIISLVAERQDLEQFRKKNWIGTFEEYRYEVERLTDLGSGAVVVAASETGRGKGSGAPVDRSFGVLYTVIEGKIARMTTFGTEQDAREAAGLRE